MRYRRQETICIWWEIYSCEFGFEVEDCSYEGRVLVREAVVLLACPGGSLDVVEGAAGLAPCCFGCLARALVIS